MNRPFQKTPLASCPSCYVSMLEAGDVRAIFEAEPEQRDGRRREVALSLDAAGLSLRDVLQCGHPECPLVILRREGPPF